MRVESPPAWLAGTWLVLAVVAISLSFAVAGEGPLWREHDISEAVQDWPFPGHTLSDAVRALTETWLVVVLGSLLSIGLFVSGHRREALVLLVLIFLLPLVQASVKNIVDRPRPTPELVEIRGSMTSESFPAGHVMSPAALYGFVIWLCIAVPIVPLGARVALMVLSAAILCLSGLVNVWLGVHWLFDVVGGYLWGAALLLPAVWLASSRMPPE